MTTISSSAGRPAASVRPRGFVRRLTTWGNSLARYWIRREAIKTLRGLDDRQLRDIGLQRCQIEAAVRGELYW